MLACLCGEFLGCSVLELPCSCPSVEHGLCTPLGRAGSAAAAVPEWLLGRIWVWQRFKNQLTESGCPKASLCRAGLGTARSSARTCCLRAAAPGWVLGRPRGAWTPSPLPAPGPEALPVPPNATGREQGGVSIPRGTASARCHGLGWFRGDNRRRNPAGTPGIPLPRAQPGGPSGGTARRRLQAPSGR